MKSIIVKPRAAITIVMVVTISIGLWEGYALYAMEHLPLHKTDCLSCHSDAKTLKAMASKAGDDLYLVHGKDGKVESNRAWTKK